MAVRSFPIQRKGKGPKPALVCRKCGDEVKVDQGTAQCEVLPGKVKPSFLGYECGGCQ